MRINPDPVTDDNGAGWKAARPGLPASWAPLIVAAFLIAPAALFVHVYMLDWLKMPYPHTEGLPGWAAALSAFIRLLTIVAFVRLAPHNLSRQHPFLLAFTFGLLMTMLSETLRVIVIEAVLVGSWPSAILNGAPDAIVIFLEFSIVAYAAAQRMRPAGLLILVAGIAVIATALAGPWLTAHIGNYREILYGPFQERYSDPYPLRIEIIIYTAFLEPTVAGFILAALCWEKLPGSRLQRTAVFAGLLLLSRGRVVALAVNSFWVAQPLPTAFLAESQFFLETLTLGLLVGASWAWLRPSARMAQS